jgi:hypothetical protein
MLILFGAKIIGIIGILSGLFYVRRNTISSQFNFVQLIIYPMKNDLFKIVIQKKDNVAK